MLSKKELRYDLIALLSAIPLTLAIQMIHTPLNWLMLVPTFYCGIDANVKTAARRGFIVGFVTAVINFFWIVSGALSFTGKNLLLGVVILLAFCLVFSIYAICVGVIYAGLRGPLNKKYSWLKISLEGGALFTLIDALMLLLGKGFSTCMHVNFIVFGYDLYAIQPAAIFGPLIITFVIATINYQVAYFLFFKKWKMLLIPFFVVIIYLGWGSWLYDSYNSEYRQSGKSVKVAILEENLPPQFTWDKTNGNRLAEEMFKMNEVAVTTGANLFIWSETAIPWNYTKNDAFIHHIDSITAPHGIGHLLGMNTDYHGRTFYNSVYSLSPGAQVLGRYDKRDALFLVEKPFMGILLPFFSNQSFRVKEGTSDEPLPTAWGNAGILLCNESSVPGAAAKSAKAGANFLVNPGNDGWFSSTYITLQHFYHARLRAVENRKDIVVNNNNGYSGIIRSNGDITLMEKESSPNIGVGDIFPNEIKNSSYLGQSVFLFMCAIFLLGCILSDKIKWKSYGTKTGK